MNGPLPDGMSPHEQLLAAGLAGGPPTAGDEIHARVFQLLEQVGPGGTHHAVTTFTVVRDGRRVVLELTQSVRCSSCGAAGVPESYRACSCCRVPIGLCCAMKCRVCRCTLAPGHGAHLPAAPDRPLCQRCARQFAWEVSCALAQSEGFLDPDGVPDRPGPPMPGAPDA